ncbi:MULTISPECIES: hypothetical protein [Caldimonas]|uniref:hypothetical protein n=1 Tax=Caldimonas TaxID=196013 RepID=UPI000366B854|nr:hypothetical protein [Caldimonas manganoxidans]MCX7659516.1 hypothetical protein [Caldimonas manganoxidans]
MVDVGTLAQEHRALVALYGQVQTRCSAQLREQSRRIQCLEAEVMRLRAAVIVQQTALAIAQEERRQWEAALPGLPRRMELSRRIEGLVQHLQSLLRERSRAAWMVIDRPGPG